MSLTTFPPAGVGDENPRVGTCPAASPLLPERLGDGATRGPYVKLQAALDAAFLTMEGTWAAWCERRPDQAALDAYLESLSECNAIHQLLKNFPQYEPFRTNFPTSPSSDGVGVCASHGVNRYGDVGGEGMVERAVRGGGGAGRCPRRLPLLGAAVPRRLAFGEPGGAGRILRVRAGARPAMRDEERVLWVALATLIAVPAVGVILHVMFR